MSTAPVRPSDRYPDERDPARARRIGIIGLGYVGLPLAVEFGRKVLYPKHRPSFAELEQVVRGR